MTFPFPGVYNRCVEKEKATINSPLAEARRYVAGALLERSGNGTGGHPRLTVRDMVASSGTDWESVRLSLRALQEEGAIRLERHRIFIRTDRLREAAAVPAGDLRP
jgi:hypothetical protein